MESNHINSWRVSAENIVHKLRKYRYAICFDLDNTFWPSFLTKPATKASVDDVDIVQSVALYPQVKEIMEWCGEQNICLSICSKSANFDAAKRTLEQLGLWNLFTHPQIYNKRKTYHFRMLKGKLLRIRNAFIIVCVSECLDLDYDYFILFDDDSRNIRLCEQLGITCQLISENGLTTSTFIDGLERFVRQVGSVTHIPSSPSPPETLASNDSEDEPTPYKLPRRMSGIDLGKHNIPLLLISDS